MGFAAIIESLDRLVSCFRAKDFQECENIIAEARQRRTSNDELGDKV